MSTTSTTDDNNAKTATSTRRREGGLLKLLVAPIRYTGRRTDVLPVSLIISSKLPENRPFLRERAVVLDKTDKIFLHSRLAETASPVVRPRWRFTEARVDAVPVRLIVDLVSRLTGVPPETLSPPLYWDTRFKSARQLSEIAGFSANARQVVLENDAGGITIVAEIPSFSDQSTSYYTAVSVSRAGDIIVSCTCPAAMKSGGRQLLCKHVVALVLSNLESIAPYLGIRTDSIDSARRELESLRSKYSLVDEAFAYYFMKFMEKRTSAAVVDAAELKNIISGSASSLVTTVQKPVSVFAGNVSEVKYDEWVEHLLEKVEKALDELKKRFGVVAMPSEWAEALMFSAIASSNPRNPPVVVHAIGRPGTFKTLGALLFSRMITNTYLVVRGRGKPDVLYSLIINLLMLHGIPVEHGQVGGIVRQVTATHDGVEVRLSLPHVLGLRDKYEDSMKLLGNIVGRLQEAGFIVSFARDGYGVRIADFRQVSDIERYRYKYIVDPYLKYLRVNDLFGEDILLVDEASRDPAGLESLLTKTSISSTDDASRIIILTDNLEPFLDVIRNPRYSPLHDRTFKVITQQVRDEKISEENIRREPETRLNVVELMALERFMSSISMPETYTAITRAVQMMLSKKLCIKLTDTGFPVFLVDRSIEEVPEAVVVEPLGDESFEFREGGRFARHVAMYARFKAMMRRHGVVEADDLLDALDIAVRSRLVTPSVRSYTEYRLVLFKAVDTVRAEVEQFLSNTELVRDIGEVIRLLSGRLDNATSAKLKSMYEKIVRGVTSTPRKYPAIALYVLLGAIEVVLSRKEISVDKLPEGLRETVMGLIIERGDWGAIMRYRGLARRVMDIMP